MEITEEKLVDIGWDEVERKGEGGKFFKPELDRMYKLRVKSAKPVKSDKFKDAKGAPKIRVVLQLASIDGKATEQVWETGSWSIMATIKPYAKAGLLDKCEFLLKQRKEGDKVSYVFEEISGVKIPASFHSPDDASAFM